MSDKDQSLGSPLAPDSGSPLRGSVIPPIYRSIGPVQGLPLNWKDEVTGALPDAMMAYMGNRIDGTPIDPSAFLLVRCFMDHYISAPCWDHNLAHPELAAILAGLRADIKKTETPEQMGEWIGRCLDIGIDPL